MTPLSIAIMGVGVRLILGDTLEEMAKLPDSCADMILCDLPYGTTACKWDTVIPFEPLWAQYRRLIKPNGAIVLFAQAPFDKVLGCSNIEQLKYEWSWRKEAGTGHLNARKMPMKDHENILVFCDGTTTYNPQMRTGFKPYTCKQGATKSQNYGAQTGATTVSDGDRYPLSTIEFKRDKDKLHPTQKPVALCEYLIRTYTNEGDTVLDNTMGSGTTGVACVNTKRSFIGIERDEKYFSVAFGRITEAAAR